MRTSDRSTTRSPGSVSFAWSTATAGLVLFAQRMCVPTATARSSQRLSAGLVSAPHLAESRTVCVECKGNLRKEVREKHQEDPLSDSTDGAAFLIPGVAIRSSSTTPQDRNSVDTEALGVRPSSPGSTQDRRSVDQQLDLKVFTVLDFRTPQPASPRGPRQSSSRRLPCFVMRRRPTTRPRPH